MRIKYKIYWFEDDNIWLSNSRVIEGISEIRKYLEDELGFQTDITFFIEKELSNTRNFRLKKLLDDYPEKCRIVKLGNYKDDNLKKIGFFNVDLVLMDYNLGSEKGNNVINYIRNDQNDIYTDILFYSQNESEKELREKSDKDGLYCSERTELFSEDKIKKVIKTTIRKTQELNNLRGLVMAETSELDEMVKEILKLVAEKDKVEEKKIIERGPKLKNTHIDKIKNIEKYNLPEQFVQFVELTYFEANFSLRTQTERNNLAHIPEDSSNPALMKIKEIEYDERKFISIRKDIQEYKKIFQKIIDDLNA